ncbi:MAG: hypothetical protein NT154_12035 [Verrucomicrobia bacterium]|nr:hypothetical protein [Verrucomicrobiota bacterium]
MLIVKHMAMLAHAPNLFLIGGFYALLLISLVTGAAACAGCFLSHRRHRWLLVTGFGNLVAGTWIAYMVLWGGAQGATWFTVLAFSPLLLGVVILLRFSTLRP